MGTVTNDGPSIFIHVFSFFSRILISSALSATDCELLNENSWNGNNYIMEHFYIMLYGERRRM